MPTSKRSLDFDEQLLQNYVYGLDPHTLGTPKRAATAQRILDVSRTTDTVDAASQHRASTLQPVAVLHPIAPSAAPKPVAPVNSDFVDGLAQAAIGLCRQLAAKADSPRLQWQVANFARSLRQPNTTQFGADPRLTAELKPHQKDGVLFLRACQQQKLGALLADEMGLGKTVQTLAVLPNNALIVAPVGVLHVWVQEARRFRPDLCLADYSIKACSAGNNVIVMSYERMRRDIDWLQRRNFDMVVFDEAQKIKNHKSCSFKAASLLQTSFRVALTGTPLENRLRELQTILNLVNPDLYDAFEQSKGPIGRGTQIDDYLKPLLDVVMLRRRKADLGLNLLPRREETILCKLPESLQQTYNGMRDDAEHALLKMRARGENAAKGFARVLPLRLFATHPALVDKITPNLTSPKLDAMFEVLNPALAQGRRALVFSQWTQMLDAVAPELNKRNIIYNRIDGSMSRCNREAEATVFRRATEGRVLLLSLTASATGLNLVEADMVLLMDPWYNPALEAQAIGRAHRIGQKKQVEVYRLLTADTTDMRFREIQDSKRILAAQTLGDPLDADLTESSKDDFEASMSWDNVLNFVR